MSIADLNGDGRLDVVAGKFTSGSVSLLLGNGIGGFGPARSFPVGSVAYGVAIADLNGDRQLDLAVATGPSNTIAVLLGLTPATSAVAVSPSPAVLGATMTLTATIRPVSPATGTPTGTVRFFDGTTLLGTAPLGGGVAALSVFAPYAGVRAFSAVYLGDARFSRSISGAAQVRVVASPKPAIASIADVKNDQGGQVRVRFRRSPFDYAGSATPIQRYDAYRRIAAGGAPLAAAAPTVTRARTAASAHALLDGWEYVGTTPAGGDSAYNLVVPTLADSNGSGIHRSAFLVRAVTGDLTTYYDSPADSGYSVDNLPPLPPAGATAAYAAGATHLHWSRNSEPDLWYYAVYRGSSAGFVPGPSNQIATRADTGYADSGPAGSYFKLAAFDVNGNQSGFTLIGPGSTTAVGGLALPQDVFLSARPNPARASATLRFGLPRESHVSLAVYDAGGRVIHELTSGRWSAGEHVIAWDLRDGAGRAAEGGVYFARLRAGVTTRVVRLIVVE